MPFNVPTFTDHLDRGTHVYSICRSTYLVFIASMATKTRVRIISLRSRRVGMTSPHASANVSFLLILLFMSAVPTVTSASQRLLPKCDEAIDYDSYDDYEVLYGRLEFVCKGCCRYDPLTHMEAME